MYENTERRIIMNEAHEFFAIQCKNALSSSLVWRKVLLHEYACFLLLPLLLLYAYTRQPP